MSGARDVPGSARRARADRLGGSRVVAVGMVLLACGGCAQVARSPTPPVDPVGNFVLLTEAIVIVGDTQEHETTGFPLADNDGAVDAYVEVAQRPPEQPLFGRRLGEWVLNQHPAEPLLHLGDVLDMSCRSELDRIWKLGRGAQAPIALLPGNHDGLMFGIFNVPLVDIAEASGRHAWHRGCLRGAGAVEGVDAVAGRAASGTAGSSIVDRRAFITAYLETLAVNPTPVAGLTPVPADGTVHISWSNPRPDPYIEAVEVRLQDGDAYANSFLAQKLRLPRAQGAPHGVIIIGLDTNQVDALVGTLDTLRSLSPGDIGHVRADQLAAVRPWIDAARQQGDLVVFAGHHNWNRLSLASRLRLVQTFDAIEHPLVYLSAHTHQGFWAMHRIGERRLLELNVSSLSDWPIAYRRVRFAYDASASRLKVIAELMPSAGRPPDSDGDLLDAWQTLACQPSGIATMRITEEELQIVEEQRSARGTMLDWLVASLGDWCGLCQQNLYASGLRYQDAMLRTIQQVYVDLLPEIPAMRTMRPPASCGAASVPECLTRLNRSAPGDLTGAISLFRQRAEFIDAMNRQFDSLADDRVRNYMACRAVIGAKIDHELTPVAQRPGGDEAHRRERDFFRTEATVGMQ
jgi:hypothetical protein